MDIAQKIYNEAQRLPDFLAQEVLDFIGYIEAKYRLNLVPDNGLKKAQERQTHTDRGEKMNIEHRTSNIEW